MTMNYFLLIILLNKLIFDNYKKIIDKFDKSDKSDILKG